MRNQNGSVAWGEGGGGGGSGTTHREPEGTEAWCPGQSSGSRGLCSRPEESGVQKPSRVREGDGSAAGEVSGAPVGRARDPTPGQISGWGSGEAIGKRL